ncbi:MAG: pyridoxal 5'-phosphate synthase glutaminase subunit PdxT [Anaerolineales bacterium]|nr:pyridoxal 5'-phosphate synthase glutaminase subunit PdxT [Anaerolineales bacterium]
MKIGVLALQGDFAEHLAMLKKIGADAVEVRLPEHLDGLNGLIIPGGESTTIGKLSVHYHLIEPLREFGKSRAIWGTCAGMIFLSNDAGRDQPLLGLMDVQVKRNAFGRQLDSFETDLQIDELSEATKDDAPYHAVFIRAPIIESVGAEVKVLAALADGRIVAARQGRLLATSFHPELTDDSRFHKYFLSLAA